MAGYLIAEEGPLAGLILRFEDGNEWVIGRDPDEVALVLEDPMVSRKHVICRKAAEGYLLENLSAVNPATQNGKIITEPVLLQEGDIIQVGNTFFRFTERRPEAESAPLFLEEASDLATLSMATPPEARWMIKVITGPNAGAEFFMQKGKSYVIGKDPEVCDIIFQDLSVSRQHARITLDDKDEVSIEDLGSRNGTLVKGKQITEKTPIVTQDLVALGTTTFMVIDREQSRETIISQAPVIEQLPEEAAVAMAVPKDWREMIIPKKHLIFAGVIGCALLALFVGMVSLFQAEPLEAPPRHEKELVAEIVKKYPDVQYSYNDGSGKLFLTGHVLTPVEKQELIYQLNGLKFLNSVEDTVVIDEYVWENMNALLMTNPSWMGVSIHSPVPGKFVVRGYLQTLEQAQALADYLNVNFPYLDRMDNQVVVESNLMTQVQSLLLERGFNNVSYQLTDGEVVLSGRVDGNDASRFDTLVKEFKALPGVRVLKNYVIYTTEESSLVDLSTKYKVMGFSKKDGTSQYIVINGKILTIGDLIDGMTITTISPNTVLLEKDGLKFKINYNLQ